MNMRLVWISHTFRKLYDVEFVVNGLAGLVCRWRRRPGTNAWDELMGRYAHVVVMVDMLIAKVKDSRRTRRRSLYALLWYPALLSRWQLGGENAAVEEVHYLAGTWNKDDGKNRPKNSWNPKHEHEIRSIIGHSGDLFYKLTWKILMMESSRTEPTTFCIHK